MAVQVHIQTAQDLFDLINTGGGTADNPYWGTDLEIYLDNDIDMSEEADFPGFGYGHLIGLFDGQGHTIKGLHFTDTGDWHLMCWSREHGISTSTIKNITFEDIAINVTGNVSIMDMGSIYYGDWYAIDAHVTGYMNGNRVVVLLSAFSWDATNGVAWKHAKHCSFSGSVYATDYFWGIVGHSGGYVTECFISSVNGTISAPNLCFIATFWTGSITNSFFIGNIAPMTHGYFLAERDDNRIYTNFNYVNILNMSSQIDTSFRLFGSHVTENMQNLVVDEAGKSTDVCVVSPSYLSDVDTLRSKGWAI